MSRRRGGRSLAVLLASLWLTACASTSAGDGPGTSAGTTVGPTDVVTTDSAPAPSTPAPAATTTSTTALQGLTPIVEQPQPQLPATVVDADGREVTITSVDRIVPLWGNIAEVLVSLGLGPQLVGRDISATFPEVAHLPLVTRAHDVSAESVLSLHPTLVFSQTDIGPPEALDQIRAAGIPVVVVDIPNSIADIDTRVRLIAASTGLQAEGEQLIERTDAQIAEVQESIPAGVPAPVVAFLYLRGSAGVYLMGGPSSGADSMIVAAGGIDAGTAMGLDRTFTAMTSEALVGAAPDVILMTTTGLESVGGIDGLLSIPGVAQTPAGLDRRVITVEDGLLYSFGARAPEALALLIQELYSVWP